MKIEFLTNMTVSFQQMKPQIYTSAINTNKSKEIDKKFYGWIKKQKSL